MELYRHLNSTISSDEIYARLAPHIRLNSVLYIEADVGTFGKLANAELTRQTFLGELADIFFKLAGPDGHIIVPAFSYSWGSTNPEKVFDILNTKAKVGTLAEFLRKHRDFRRTMDPMFSFSVYGKRKNELVKVGNDSFGRDSVFAKMLRENAYLISFGLHKYDPTFVHFVEQNFSETVAPCLYRARTEFKGEWIDEDGRRASGTHYCMMRPLDSRYTFSEQKLVARLKQDGLIKTVQIGGAPVHISDCQSVYSIGKAGMKLDPYFFAAEE